MRKSSTRTITLLCETSFSGNAYALPRTFTQLAGNDARLDNANGVQRMCIGKQKNTLKLQNMGSPKLQDNGARANNEGMKMKV